MLLDRDAAVVVRDGAELSDFVRRCLAGPEFAAQLGERAQSLIRDHRGATLRTLRLITPLVDPPAKWHQDAA
jgi:hypothetical protein